MHIALNAWFWNRPDTGSGQYLRSLTRALHALDPGLVLTLIAPHGWAIDAPEDVKVVTAPGRGSGNLAKVRFEQQDFPRLAAQAGAELAHVPYWGAPLGSPIPFAVTIHDLIPLVLPDYRGGALGRLYTALVSASARGAAAVITDSEHSRQDIITRLSLPPQLVTAIPLAAGPEYHPRPTSALDDPVRRKYGLPPDYVLYLGGFDVRKNVDTLIRAYAYVLSGTAGQVPLVLAGRLPARRSPRFIDVERLLADSGAGQAVRLIGAVSDADKPAVYRGARCFVFPSRYEGFGLPVLEAMACGVPVVTSDRSSLPEIVGQAAFTVAPDDARHLAGSILAVLVQDSVAQDLKEKGLARARAFSWERTARETLAVWARVLSGAA